MRSKNKWIEKLHQIEKEYSFSMGYKMLYCPWKTLDHSEIAFLSLNPGANVPQNSDLRTISDERGNSYKAEEFTTESSITPQFLKLCNFIRKEPENILTGVACPFRSDTWNPSKNKEGLTKVQQAIGLKLGKEFWSEALTGELKAVIVLGDEPTKMILDIFDAKLKMQIPSGWGSCSLKSYTSSRGTKIIQLPHLSRFMLFSRDACKEPLKTIFEDLTH